METANIRAIKAGELRPWPSVLVEAFRIPPVQDDPSSERLDPSGNKHLGRHRYRGKKQIANHEWLPEICRWAAVRSSLR